MCPDLADIGGMALTHAVVEVGTEATALASLRAGERAMSVAIQNNSGVAVSIGASEVTAAAPGYVLADGGELYLTLHESGDVVYGVVASGTADVNVLTVEGK